MRNRLTKGQLLALGPPCARNDVRLSSLVRSLADYLGELGLLAAPVRTPSDRLIDTYCQHLLDVRGLASLNGFTGMSVCCWNCWHFWNSMTGRRRYTNSALHDLRSSSRS